MNIGFLSRSLAVFSLCQISEVLMLIVAYGQAEKLCSCSVGLRYAARNYRCLL